MGRHLLEIESTSYDALILSSNPNKSLILYKLVNNNSKNSLHIRFYYVARKYNFKATLDLGENNLNEIKFLDNEK